MQLVIRHFGASDHTKPPARNSSLDLNRERYKQAPVTRSPGSYHRKTKHNLGDVQRAGRNGDVDAMIHAIKGFELEMGLDQQDLEFKLNRKAVEEPAYCSGQVLQFTALSYMWGASFPAQEVWIEGCGQEGWLSVGKNLYNFLLLRRATVVRSVWFWIDRICNNQQDSVEKSAQVNQMSAVYARAHDVEVWLGPAFAGSDEAMDWLACTTWGDRGRLIQRDRVEPPPPDFDEEAKRHFTALKTIWNLPYWSRVWSVQGIPSAPALHHTPVDACRPVGTQFQTSTRANPVGPRI